MQSNIGMTPPTIPVLAPDLIYWPHIPTAIRNQLQSYRDIREDRHVALLRCLDGISETRFEKQRAEARVQHIQRQSRDRSDPGAAARRASAALRGEEVPVDDHPALQQAKEIIARCSATIARLSQREAELSASWSAAAQLLENLEWYLRQHCTREVRLLKGATPQLLKGETALAGIERAARRVRALFADRQQTLAAPFPSAVAKELARQQIAGRAASAQPDVSGLLDRLGLILFGNRGLPIEELSPHGVQPDAVGLLMWLFPKEFVAAIDRKIDAEADDPIALTQEQRVKKLKEIDGDILASEREEAAFSELAGLLPRSALDPRAVLNLSSDMPAEQRNAR